MNIKQDDEKNPDKIKLGLSEFTAKISDVIYRYQAREKHLNIFIII